jgi:hypothetical protein
MTFYSNQILPNINYTVYVYMYANYTDYTELL